MRDGTKLGLFLVMILMASPQEAVSFVTKAREKIPYRPQWVSIVKKGRLFKYKRKEFSSPRIYGDRIFVGSDGGFFYAMRKKNGRKVWRFKTVGSVNSAPAFWDREGGEVVFGDDKGNLYALAASKGTEVWRVNLGSEILTAPAIEGDRVFVATIEGKVAALRLSDGHLIWEKMHPQEGLHMTILGNSPPAVDQTAGRVYVGFSDGTFWALSASDGRLAWEKNLGKAGGFDDVDGEAVFDNDRIYIGSFDGGVYALSKRTGEILWRGEVGSGVRLLSRGDVLYVSGSDGSLYAYSKKGEKLWSTRIGEGALTAPLIYKDVIAVGLSNETMNFVDASDGHVIARRFARKGVFSDPILDDNRIFYLSNGGRLYSLKFVR